MRNYISTRAMNYRAFLFDDMHNPQGDFPVYVIGRNDVDLKSQIDITNSQLISTLPPGWTYEFTYSDALTIYFLLDKDSLFVTFQAFAGSYVADAVANQPPFFPMLVNPKTSPRYTGWKDPAGVKRAPPPSDKKGRRGDFSGAQGLFDAAKALLAYSQALRASGNLRGAGIVKFAYDRVFDGTWTITQAFDYLRKNGLV